METELCKLALKYGADKCPQINHMYTPFYYEYLKDKKYSIKKVLEFGVGNNSIIPFIPGYKPGASLRMWRDFFPNAQIYGADIAKEAIFTEDRITTFYANEFEKESVEKLITKTGSDIDLFIDDADHHTNRQIDLCEILMPLLKKDVIYIIEDCNRTGEVQKHFPQYDCFIPELMVNPRPRSHGGIIVLRNR